MAQTLLPEASRSSEPIVKKQDHLVAATDLRRSIQKAQLALARAHGDLSEAAGTRADTVGRVLDLVSRVEHVSETLLEESRRVKVAIGQLPKDGRYQTRPLSIGLPDGRQLDSLLELMMLLLTRNEGPIQFFCATCDCRAENHLPERGEPISYLSCPSCEVRQEHKEASWIAVAHFDQSLLNQRGRDADPITRLLLNLRDKTTPQFKLRRVD